MENNHTMADLQAMQSWGLDQKIRATQTRCLEWCIKHEWEIYISFSAGKDSCVLTDLIARIWAVSKDIHGNKPLTLVYSDTGMEFIEVKKHAGIFKNWLQDTYNIDIDLIIIAPKINTHKVFKEIGYPIISKKISRCLRDLTNPTDTNYYSRRLNATGMKMDGSKSKSFELAKKWKKLFKVDETNMTAEIPFKVSEKCCNYFKKEPLHNYEKESKKATFVGTMADDSDTRKNGWLLTGCNNFNKGGQSKPISFWMQQDILQYIRDYNVPISSVYGDIVGEVSSLKTTGEHNTGCKYCMFGCHLEKGETRFERLKVLEPKSYEYAMREENGLGMAKVLDFIGVKY